MKKNVYTDKGNKRIQLITLFKIILQECKKREEKHSSHFHLSEMKALHLMTFTFQDILVHRDFEEGRS